jgi:hypothetical protein
VSLPLFDPDTGYFPPGEHPATWAELTETFGWNAERRAMLDGLHDALVLLAQSGCTKVWLNGSFVTTKAHPADFDAVGRHRHR